MKPWFERDPDRYQAERSFWAKNGLSERRRPDGDVRFTGTITVRVGQGDGLERHDFELCVRYPAGFPYLPPAVEFLNPPIRRARHQSPGGEPCLFPVRAWTESVPAAEVHHAIQRWLRAYVTDSFPRELALYELPEYFRASELTVLVPAGFLASCRGRDAGRFGVAKARALDLGVVVSVDGNRVGDGLVDGLRLRQLPTKPSNGRWYRVEPEPPIHLQRTSELGQFLREQGHELRTGRGPTEHGLVGLVFNDRVLGQERLLLLDYSAAGKQQRPVRGWSVRAPSSFVVSRPELFRRLDGIRDSEALAERRVVVLGAGAIGSVVAEALAREGVGAFTLCDPDHLRPGNVARHALDLFSAGRPKASALDDGLHRINPFVETAVEETGDVLRSPTALANLMSPDHPLNPADLVVAAIGDDVVETLLSEIAIVTTSAPVLFVRILHHGAVARVILHRPGRGDACMECLRLHQEQEHPQLISVPDPPEREIYDEGCATPAEPGAGLASQQAAILGAKRALEVLESRDGDTNHWVWIDRALPDARDPRLHEADRLYSLALPEHRHCSICHA